jgi:hypothetical protein
LAMKKGPRTEKKMLESPSLADLPVMACNAHAGSPRLRAP